MFNNPHLFRFAFFHFVHRLSLPPFSMPRRAAALTLPTSDTAARNAESSPQHSYGPWWDHGGIHNHRL